MAAVAAARRFGMRARMRRNEPRVLTWKAAVMVSASMMVMVSAGAGSFSRLRMEGTRPLIPALWMRRSMGWLVRARVKLDMEEGEVMSTVWTFSVAGEEEGRA